MLYANGCSFTYGTGLAHKNKAWPFMLGEKLGIKDIETDAERGISNQYIVRQTITKVSEAISNSEVKYKIIKYRMFGVRENMKKNLFTPTNEEMRKYKEIANSILNENQLILV